MEPTIFARILAREVPADIVYEDADTLAFLDIAPNNPGHTLVIPKRPVRDIFEADDATLAAVMHTAKRVATAVRDAVNADGINIYSNHGAAAGQVVFHLHLHVIPRFMGDFSPHFPKKPYAPGEAERIAEAIRVRLTDQG